MKKEICFQNKSEVSHQLVMFEDIKPLVDRVLAEWSKLGLDVLTIEKLNLLLSGGDIRKIVQQSITESLKPEDLIIAGKPASREAMASLLTPPDISDLVSVVEEASMRQAPLQICRIHSNRIEIDAKKFEELQASNTVLTDDTETLTQVRSLISGVKYLIDNDLVPKGIISDLQRWHVVDRHTRDGLQPSRSLFKKQ